jgi:hypothetical protein
MGVLTMSNIPKRSDRFMAHIAVTYFYSFLFYGVIMWTFKRYTALRTSYLAANCVRAYTLLLRGIPSDLLGKKVLRRWFEARLNASVVAVNFVWSAGRLDSLKEQRSKLLVKLEKAEMQADRTIYTRRGIFELFGEKVRHPVRIMLVGRTTHKLERLRSKRPTSTRSESNSWTRRLALCSKRRAGSQPLLTEPRVGCCSSLTSPLPPSTL